MNRLTMRRPSPLVRCRYFGKKFGPRTTPGGKVVLQPGWEKGDDFPRLQHALLPWLFFKHRMVGCCARRCLGCYARRGRDSRFLPCLYTCSTA